MLITKKKYLAVRNKRIIKLGSDLKVEDKISQNSNFKLIKNTGSFVSIHMASKSYWQLQDEEKKI